MKKHHVKTWLLCFFALLLMSSSVHAQTRTVTGTIIDENGERMPLVTVAVPGYTTGATTDFDGRFSLSVPQGTPAIQISFIGYKTQTVALTTATNYDIRLEPAIAQLATVEITGGVSREKESFTGSFTTVQIDELRQVGSSNIVESLKTLDASFIVMENMAFGADPNATPNIQVRGSTAIVDPNEVGDLFGGQNQPLFILDGFVSTLQAILDLDFNRVQSVTLLKDAASTAFYGSRAANGVLVVETVRAAPGPFRISYTGDFSVEIPNISSFNMMNAKEKLEFERLSGRFTGSSRTAQDNLDDRYNEILKEIARGVNTYWLAEPLQIPFRQRHSLRFSGGSEEILLAGGFSFNDRPGVMKGSGRKTWTADLDLRWTRGNFSLFNQLGLSGYTALGTPYGNFSDWVNANPYYRMYDENGVVQPNLDEISNNVAGAALFSNYFVANPLYNALLPNQIDRDIQTEINERLRAKLTLDKGMAIEAAFQLNYRTRKGLKFAPPEHTQFQNADIDQRGLYSNNTRDEMSWMADLGYSWNQRVGDHSWRLNAKGEATHSNVETTNWWATGFPLGATGNPSFASRYSDRNPTYQESIRRQLNAFVSGNYSYRNRYLLDLTYRLDGSTSFGTERRFSPFWSAGLGWNMHEESFFKQYRWITSLRLRGSIGETGNQNMGSMISSTIYRYQSGSNVFFGPGLYISALGNPNLDWQKTMQTSGALEMSLFNGRLHGTFEVFEKRTSPMVTNVDQPPSVGVTSLAANLGVLTYHGFEYDVTYGVIRSKNFSWRVKAIGTTLRGKYSKFGNSMESSEEALVENNRLERFRDDYAPETIWAVRSLGIDPATGREAFLKKNGTPTFVYDPADVMPVGSRQPALQGVLTNSFMYKQFTFSFSVRYVFGRDFLNDALYNKVENINFTQIANNQDKRALHGRWNPETPGVPAQFKSIGMTAYTPMSSRFVQRENSLTGESMSLMWTLNPRENPWISKLKMQSLSFQANANGGSGGIFRLSNVLRERGTSFPEAMSITLTINATF
jgi:TonB-linked SusC/RagA family outer membrane protein